VNQLYWRKKAIYNKLIVAAEARQKAHAKLLSGKSSDVAAADAAHSTALRAAAEAAREILKDAGHDESHTIANAVNETLQALPGSGTTGRLTEPLKPAGFEALAGLVKGGVHVPKLVAKPAPAPATEQKRERHDTEKSLREARHDAKAAETALNATRRNLARAKEERERLQDQLQFAIKKVEDTSTELREREQQATRAAQEVTRLEAKLETLQ
jgi:hypothetical protein